VEEIQVPGFVYWSYFIETGMIIDENFEENDDVDALKSWSSWEIPKVTYVQAIPARRQWICPKQNW